MMNNCWFRIKVKNTFAGPVFQHPTTWMDPSKADKVSLEPAFKWSAGSWNLCEGEWSVGEGLEPLNLTLSTNNAGGKVLTSKEKPYGGEPFTGTVIDGNSLLAKFGPFFEVRGEMQDGVIVWGNGAKWFKSS